MMSRTNLFAVLAALSLCGVAGHAESNATPGAKVSAVRPDFTGSWTVKGMGSRPRGAQPTVGPPVYPNEAARKAAEAAMSFHPDFKPEAEAQYQAKIQEVLKADGQKACEGFGFPSNMVTGMGLFAVSTAKATTLLFGMGGESRVIYTDGRGDPSPDELWPTQNGYSIGRWEGRTLVVKTFDPNGLMIIAPYLNGRNAPSLYISDMLSEQAVYTERMQFVGPDEMKYDLTIEDPEKLNSPWHFTRTYQRSKNMERVIVENCFGGGDRNPLIDGKYIITPAK